MNSETQNSVKLSFGEFLDDIRYVITSPARRFAVIHERGAMWGSLVLLVAPVYFAFFYVGGIYFDRDPFPGYSFLMPAVFAAGAQLMKAFFIHFFGRLFEGKWHYSAATGKFRDMIVLFGYSTVPGSLAAILAAILFLFAAAQIGVALHDFRAITISVLIAIGVGLFIWNLILFVLALRLVYPMRDYKIVAAFLLGSALVGVPAVALSAVTMPIRVQYSYVQPMISTRVVGLLACSAEESRGQEAKLSVYVDRVAYSFGKPKHFDLVAYEPLPGKQGEETSKGGVVVYGKTSMFSWHEEDQLVGRIVGLPGDSVELLPGKIRINGRLWAEPYVPAEFQTYVAMPPTHLGTAEYLVLPDNRHLLEGKKDDWIINRGRITGRVLVHKWPMGWAIFSPAAFQHAYPID